MLRYVKADLAPKLLQGPFVTDYLKKKKHKKTQNLKKHTYSTPDFSQKKIMS